MQVGVGRKDSSMVVGGTWAKEGLEEEHGSFLSCCAGADRLWEHCETHPPRS